MAKINAIIPTSNFELIRDRIAQILTVELANQKVLTANTLFDAVVWVERFIAFDKTELPAINVYYSGTTFDSHTPITSIGDSKFNIDVHLSSKHVNGIDGDKNALVLLQKLCGVIRAILHNPEYVTLDFDPGLIRHRSISDIQIAQPKEKDTALVVTGRLTLTIVANESVKEITPITADRYSTVVTLGETDKGFFYETINT